MDVIEKLLSDLHTSIESDGGEEACSIIDNIEANAITDDVDIVNINQISNLLLKSISPPSLFQFVISPPHSKDNKQIVKAKVKACKAVAKYIKSMDDIDQYAYDLYDKFYKTFKKEESNEVKVSIAMCLKNVFRHCQINTTDGDNTIIDNEDKKDLLFLLSYEKISLYNVFKLFSEIIRNPKSTKGLKCILLKVVGLLISIYTDCEAIQPEIIVLMKYCKGELKRNFKKEGS